MARRRCPQPAGLIVVKQTNGDIDEHEVSGVQNTNKHLPFVSFDNAVLLHTFNSSVQGTKSEVKWNDIPFHVDRQAPFSLCHALLSGFVWVERCILLISASATHWSHSVLAPFTSCTVLPFDLHLNRKERE